MSLLGCRIGNYEIRAKIGEGGMGTVWLGEHPLIGKRVAVKVLLEELVAKEDVVSRFFHEAKAVNDIGHVNIVDIVDFGRTPGPDGRELVYLVMELLEGEALSTRIRRQGLPFKDTVHIIAQCCSALAASHAKNVVHRDLKPENVYLVSRGGDPLFVKLLDFGIAKLTGEGGTSSHKTRTGLVIGTPTYMSPEQCEGKGHIDHRSDIYSLGVVLYELLTGAVPFPGEGFGEVLVAHLTQQPPAPSSVNPSVPPALEAIVLHAMEKDRNRRFQSMTEMAAALADPEAHLRAWRPLPGYSPSAPTLRAIPVQSGRTVALDDAVGPTARAGAPRPTTLEGAAAEVTLPPTRRPRRRGPLVALAAAAVALLGAGGWLALSRLGAPEAQPAAVVPAPRPALPVDDTVTITVASDPPGAQVRRADRGDDQVEHTPVTYRLKKGSAPFDIQLRAEGYLPETRTITSARSIDMLVSLARVPSAAPVAAAPPKAPPAPVSKPAKVARTRRERNHHEAQPVADRPAAAPAAPPKSPPPLVDDDLTILPPSFGDEKGKRDEGQGKRKAP